MIQFYQSRWASRSRIYIQVKGETKYECRSFNFLRLRYSLLFLRASGMKVVLLLHAAAAALSKVVDTEAMISKL